MAYDGSFKSLIAHDLTGALQALVPDLAEVLGVPQGATLLSSEVLPLAADQRSRLMDLAILYTWSSGHQAVILQIEHWSRTRDLDLRRALRYTSDLLLRYPTSAVVPVMVLCDHSPEPPDRHLVIAVGGRTVIDFQVWLVQVQTDIIPRLQTHPSLLLAVMSALVTDLDPVESAFRSLRWTLTFGLEATAAALPIIEDFARLASDSPLQRLFHDRIRQDRTMSSVADIFRAEGKAEGKAEGLVAGTADTLRELLADGIITASQAHLRIQHLLEQRRISESQAEQIRLRLGC